MHGGILTEGYPNDPGHRGIDTSITAAENIKMPAKEIRFAIVELLRSDLWRERGATSEELSEILRQKYKRVQPRTSELQVSGHIRDSGRTRKNADGSDCIVWVAI